tara:strand:+ start:500 stop:1300 length:801 start_codon:yes stop_codon:yes gene_type:complete
MIYCNLKGALGNMMFQIATATSFAIERNTSASFPNLHNHLNYLNKENCHIPSLKHAHEYLKIFSDLRFDSPNINLLTVKYPFHYEDKSLPLSCWVDGFFQSEKYFSKHREKILNLFSIPDEIFPQIKKYEKYNKLKTVSLHVRRGDYLKFSKTYRILSLDYYKTALEIIGDIDKVLIFSDDIPWCIEKFGQDKRSVFIDEKDYISLFLMAKCDHNIIANSSFSWWGAWLNTSQKKKVICPSQWVGAGLSHLNTCDIHCVDWIKIKG